MNLRKSLGLVIIGGMLCLFFCAVFFLASIVVTEVNYGMRERIDHQTEPLEERVQALERRIEVLEQQKEGGTQ